MRLCRFNTDKLGLVEDGVARDVMAARDVIPPVRWPVPIGYRMIAHLDPLLARIERMIELASANYTLHPGNILLTGTPEGVGPVVAGDVIVARCDGVGDMTLTVKAG